MRDYRKVIEVLESNDRFLLTSHLFPDGDGLGSAVGLAGGLRMLGKDVRIVVPTPMPELYRFIDPEGEIAHWSREFDMASLTDRQVAVVLDCSEWKRIGRFGEALRKLPLSWLCLDHHVAGTGFGGVSLVDTSAGATAEMVFELLVREKGLELDAAAARGLYTSLVTETGGFKYSNTTPALLRMAADLIERGVDAAEVSIQLGQRRPLRQLRLLGRALETLRLSPSGQVAWVAIGPEDFAAAGATDHDVDGLVDYPRSLDGVEVAFMFFEDVPGSVKISFRSKRWFDVSALARQFQGGGHVRASGAHLATSLADAVARVTDAAEREIGTQSRSPLP